MLSLEWSPQQIFVAGAIPAFIAALAVMVSGRSRGNSTAYHSTPDPGPAEAA